MNIKDTFVASLVPIFLGFGFVIAKPAFESFPPVLLMGIRFTFAAANVNLIPIKRTGGKDSNAGLAITKPKPKKIGTKDATKVSFIFIPIFYINDY